MLSLRQITNVCLLGGGQQQCRYLAREGDKYYCLKKNSRKQDIDEEIVESLKEGDPRQDMPMGDNCPGYIILKNTVQGFDIK
jgi:hypothetical protein